MPTKMGSNMDSIGPTGTVPAVRVGPVMAVLLRRERRGTPGRSRPWGSLAGGVASQVARGRGRPGGRVTAPGDGLDQIQSEMSPPSLAAGAEGDAGVGILGWSGRLSGVGRVVMTSLAGTWGR